MSKRIVLFQSINTQKAKRGPHFFFPMFFRDYQKEKHQENELWYLIKTDHVDQLKSMLYSFHVPLGRVIILQTRNHRFKTIHERLDMRWALIRLKPELFHVLTYASKEDLPLLKEAQKRIKRLLFTVTYNAIPLAFSRDDEPRYKKDREKYGQLFREIKFKGILSWYDDIPAFMAAQDWINPKPEVAVIDSRYCDATRFSPIENKKKQIVFASAFAPYKQPSMFVEAIISLFNSGFDFGEWKFLMVGEGPEEIVIKAKIHHSGISELVEVHPPTEDIAPILNASMAYISCQDHENFPSLAMNEAMAAGNAIIARPVGRTYLFVHHEENGYIAEEDSAVGLALAIKRFISLCDEDRSKMMKFSHQLTKDYHTPERFRQQVDAFWSKL